MNKKCPKCGSEDIEKVKLFGKEYLNCNNCGYDESDDFEIPSDKGGKKRRNVYRTGGGRRTSKK